MASDDEDIVAEVPEVLRFRVRPRSLTFRKVYVAASAFALLMFDVATLVGRWSRLGPGKTLLICGLFTMFAVVLIMWLSRVFLSPSVIADEVGLHVYNGFRRYVVPWTEVDGFENSSTMPFLFAVKRKHGRPIFMAGITPEPFGRRGPQLEDMQRLEGYWHRVTGRV